MFCNRSRTKLLLRGLGAVALIAVAWVVGARHPGLAVMAVGGALVLLRGCPMCWLAAWFSTGAHRRCAALKSGDPSP